VKERLQFVRLALLLLGLFFVGKLIVGASGGSYALGTRLFAMVPLTVQLCLLWGAMTRAFRGRAVGEAALTGITIALFAQILIFTATIVSDLLGVSTHFNDPMAIVGADRPVPLGEAVMARGIGIVINTVIGAIAGSIGWALGALLPSRENA
jgi:hypothetical protein